MPRQLPTLERIAYPTLSHLRSLERKSPLLPLHSSRAIPGNGGETGYAWREVMRGFFALGAGFAFLGVLAGAFGAHALRGSIPDDLFEAFRTGALYHLIHALALVGLGLGGATLPEKPTRLAGLGFCVGIVLFSGSLYAMALTGYRAFGAVTPFGGVAFLFGWAALFHAGLKAR